MRRKWFVALGLVLALILSACTEDKVTILTKQEDDVVDIPILFRIDPETGEEEYADLIHGFNQEYAGKYRLDVMWVIESEQGYRERLKTLNAFDRLPLIITDAAFSEDFQNLMVSNGRFVDMRPYFREREEWSALLEKSPEEIYLVPLEMGLYSSAGLYYNKDLFLKAGIERFPDTWDDFTLCLHKLRDAGVIPLALHGGGEFWSPMLISTAFMCSSEDGRAFLDVSFPDSYDNQSIRDMLSCMREIYNYTFEDALDISYNQAQERFLNGEAAILANGFWMIQNIDPEIRDDFGFAPFPGNMMMIDAQMSSWAVISGYSEEEIQGAVEFLTYRQKNSAVDENSDGALTKEYLSVFRRTQLQFANYQLRWNEKLLSDFFGSSLPGFIIGEYTADEFIEQMDEELRRIESQG